MEGFHQRMAVYLLVLVALLSGCQKEERGSVAPSVPSIAGAPTPAHEKEFLHQGSDQNPNKKETVAAVPPTVPEVSVSPSISKPLSVKPVASAPISPKPVAPNEPSPFLLATLEVEGYPARNAQTAVMLAQSGEGNNVKCEIAKDHPRIRKDAKWSPLPLILWNPAKPGEVLSAVFNQTLDFPTEFREITKHGYQFIIDFTRGKHFRALWRVETRRYSREDKSVHCKVQLDVCLEPELVGTKYKCPTKWHELKRLVTHVDTSRFLRHSFEKSERTKDDIYRLELELRDLDEDGYPTGETFSEDVAIFK